MADIEDHTKDTHYEPDNVTGEYKPVNETVRPDPRPATVSDDSIVPAQGIVPEHKEGAIEGVIQFKDSPDGPIHEKLPDEQDLAEGKITPAAVEKVEKTYANGVTQEDIDLGRISPTAVSEWRPPGTADKFGVPLADEDVELNEMVTAARNKTSLSRLNHAEAMAVFKTLQADGYTFNKA